MLAQFEIYFGRTLVRSQQGELQVEKTKGRIIRDRFVKSERLLLLLHPEFHNSFNPILNMITECREKINSKADVLDKEEKIKYLQGLETIVKQFEKDEKPFENALEDFQRILSNTEGDAKFYIADLVKSNFTQNINRNLVAEYKNRSKCFSRVMSNADLIKFWFDDNSLKQDRLGPKNLTLIKSVIISFLGGDLKAIILEFFFAISNPPFKDSKRINRQKKELLE